MGRWIGSLCDRGLSLLFALLLIQVPFFMHQYLERLSGHAKEAQLQVVQVERDAERSGKTLSQYIQKFSQSRDPDFARQGMFLDNLSTRSDRLLGQMNALKNASPWTRPFLFAAQHDWQIVRETVADFQWGIAFTGEVALYAVVGLLFGNLLYLGLRGIGRTLFLRKPLRAGTTL